MHLNIDLMFISKTNDYNNIKNRALYEFNTKRIYVYYPYEIIYLYADVSMLNSEQKKKYRKHNNIVQDLHRILNRNHNKLLKNIIDYSINTKHTSYQSKLIKKLDIYSLGISILKLFRDNLDKTNITKLFNDPRIIPYKELLFKMTEPFYYDRISSLEALKD